MNILNMLYNQENKKQRDEFTLPVRGLGTELVLVYVTDDDDDDVT